MLSGWPLELMQNTSFQQPLFGDLNNDGILDLVGGSFNFDIANKQVFLYAWNTGLHIIQQKLLIQCISLIRSIQEYLLLTLQYSG